MKTGSIIHSGSGVLFTGALALAALAGCKHEDKHQGAEYPSGQSEITTQESQSGQTGGTSGGAQSGQEGSGQQGYQPGQQGYQPGQQGYQPGQQGYQPGQQGGQAGQGGASPSGQPCPPGQGQGDTSASSQAQGDADLQTMTVTGIDIDTKLAQLCNLPGTNVFFKFDSARLQTDSRERLQQIATCVTTGAAKGKSLRVVGYTDPRGSDEYNKQLGMSRAEAVVRQLRELGIPKARVEAESKGEAGSAREPRAWPIERRVTIRIQ